MAREADRRLRHDLNHAPTPRPVASWICCRLCCRCLPCLGREWEAGRAGREGDTAGRPYGARGDTVIVNGVIAPVAKVPPCLVRLRILNAANAQNFVLRFSDQRTFHVIAADGGFLPAPVAVTQLTISPAERFEVLVDFENGKAVALETGPDEENGNIRPLGA